jgi:DNA polymerase III alpha subunit
MDIDIDLPPSFDPTKVFKECVRASMVTNDDLKKHPCGVYFQNVPVDQITGLCAIPYQQAEEIGYTKIDFLHLTLLENVRTKQEIRQLMDQDPDWNLLLVPDCVSRLFQVSKHGELLKRLKPQNVEELADVIALIRPGKKHLIEAYSVNKSATRKELYTKTDTYYFKKSHAISYALTIVLQMHLYAQGRLK